MSSSTTLPPTMQALVLPAKGQPLALQEIPTPKAVQGSVVVKVLAAAIDSSLFDIMSGKGFFTFPEPFVPGPRSIGRIAARGPDATSITQDQLVAVDPFIRARDNPDVQAIFAIFDGPTPTSKAWVADNWRNGAYATFVSVPLENVHPLNETVLCKQLNYTPADLVFILTQVVAYAGLRNINLQAGETVVVAPATGSYSGAAIGVAVAMGATVIAASRNIDVLRQTQRHFPEGRVHLVQLTGNVETDTTSLTAFGPVDAFIDISPPRASETTHVRSCFNALRQYGRACLAGAISQDVAMSYVQAVFKNITIRGQYMHDRAHLTDLIRLVESGVLKLGKDIGVEIAGRFGLDDLQGAFECAQKNDGYGKITTLVP